MSLMARSISPPTLSLAFWEVTNYLEIGILKYSNFRKNSQKLLFFWKRLRSLITHTFPDLFQNRPVAVDSYYALNKWMHITGKIGQKQCFWPILVLPLLEGVR